MTATTAAGGTASQPTVLATALQPTLESQLQKVPENAQKRLMQFIHNRRQGNAGGGIYGYIEKLPDMQIRTANLADKTVTVVCIGLEKGDTFTVTETALRIELIRKFNTAIPPEINKQAIPPFVHPLMKDTELLIASIVQIGLADEASIVEFNLFALFRGMEDVARVHKSLNMDGRYEIKRLSEDPITIAPLFLSEEHAFVDPKTLDTLVKGSSISTNSDGICYMEISLQGIVEPQRRGLFPYQRAHYPNVMHLYSVNGKDFYVVSVDEKGQIHHNASKFDKNRYCIRTGNGQTVIYRNEVVCMTLKLQDEVTKKASMLSLLEKLNLGQARIIERYVPVIERIFTLSQNRHLCMYHEGTKGSGGKKRFMVTDSSQQFETSVQYATPETMRHFGDPMRWTYPIKMCDNTDNTPSPYTSLNEQADSLPEPRYTLVTCDNTTVQLHPVSQNESVDFLSLGLDKITKVIPGMVTKQFALHSELSGNIPIKEIRRLICEYAGTNDDTLVFFAPKPVASLTASLSQLAL